MIIEKTPTKRIEVFRVELGGEQRLALCEHEHRGQRWASTRYGFTIALEVLPEPITALRGVQCAGDNPMRVGLPHAAPGTKTPAKSSVKSTATRMEHHGESHGGTAGERRSKTAVKTAVIEDRE